MNEKEDLHPAVRFLGMIALGPITFIGALQADFHTSADQFVAGMVGTFLWFMVIMEVVTYV